MADEADAMQWLGAQAAGWASSTWFSFAMVADDDDPPIGHVVVKVGIAGVAEVGTWTTATVRSHGIASRALDTASFWALGTQNLTRLDLLHAKDNRASCRVAEKCGYVLYNLLPSAPPLSRTADTGICTPLRGTNVPRHVRASGRCACALLLPTMRVDVRYCRKRTLDRVNLFCYA
ncbi:GNAT family N-acetyltransferase [Umezawaea sp. NPDC059074]|uniref:GNAT family N-acetyltransferase n=1 Tax=Umezawaea sp. NPDC059074 TaxID=3346716 RepID=UPI003678B3CE